MVVTEKNTKRNYPKAFCSKWMKFGNVPTIPIPQSNGVFTINKSFSWETFAFAKASLLWISPVVNITCWSTRTRHLGEGTRRHTHGVLQGISCNHPAILTWARHSNDIPTTHLLPECCKKQNHYCGPLAFLHIPLTQNLCDQWCHWWQLTRGFVPHYVFLLLRSTGHLWQYSARCSLDKVCQHSRLNPHS